MPVTVKVVGEAELPVWLEHYARRGYRGRLVEGALSALRGSTRSWTTSL